MSFVEKLYMARNFPFFKIPYFEMRAGPVTLERAIVKILLRNVSLTLGTEDESFFVSLLHTCYGIILRVYWSRHQKSASQRNSDAVLQRNDFVTFYGNERAHKKKIWKLAQKCRKKELPSLEKSEVWRQFVGEHIVNYRIPSPWVLRLLSRGKVSPPTCEEDEHDM